MIITRVDRYIFRQILPPMAFSFLAVAVLMISGILQQQIRELMNTLPFVPLRITDFVWMSIYALPMMIGMIIPVTYLFGIMLTFERMSRYREIVAMNAGGISLKRVAMPTIVFSMLLSVVCFVVQDRVQPFAFRQLMNLARVDLPLRITLDLLPTGQMVEYGKLRVYIRERNKAGELLGIVLLQPSEQGKVIAFYAEKARWRKGDKENYIEMFNGYWIESRDVDERITRGSFERLEKVIPPLEPLETLRLRSGMSTRELMDEHKRLSKEYHQTQSFMVLQELKKFRSEIADRFAFPLMCLALGLTATPLGVRMRGAGTAYAFAIGFLLAGLYFVAYKAVSGWDVRSLPLKCVIQQLPNIIYGLLGLYWWSRADRV